MLRMGGTEWIEVGAVEHDRERMDMYGYGRVRLRCAEAAVSEIYSGGRWWEENEDERAWWNGYMIFVSAVDKIYVWRCIF